MGDFIESRYGACVIGFIHLALLGVSLYQNNQA
jgi:hypothetical protein